MIREIEDALENIEATRSPAALQYVASVVGGCGLKPYSPENLAMLEEIGRRIEPIYERMKGDVPPALDDIRAAIKKMKDDVPRAIDVVMAAIKVSKGSYKLPPEEKNLS